VNEEQYKTVLEGARWAQAHGWKLQTGIWIAPRKRECCALGGWALSAGCPTDDEADLFACVGLECDYDSVVQFGNGFDGADGEGAWWEAGRRMRKELGL
jgi:hypothetical protein